MKKLSFFQREKSRIKDMGLLKEQRTMYGRKILILDTEELVKGIKDKKNRDKQSICDNVLTFGGIVVEYNLKNKNDRFILMADGLCSKEAWTYALGLSYIDGPESPVPELMVLSKYGQKGMKRFINALFSFYVKANKMAGLPFKLVKERFALLENELKKKGHELFKIINIEEELIKFEEEGLLKAWGGEKDEERMC